MNFKHLVFGSLFIFILSDCKSSSDKIIEDFSKVNEELQKTNQLLDSTAKVLTFYGFNKKEADSILLILNNASNFLKRIKAELGVQNQKKKTWMQRKNY